MPTGDDTTRAIERVARLGWIAKGLLYLALAAMVYGIATGASRGDTADSQGALRQLGQTGPGWILYVVAIGLLLYAAWRALGAWFIDDDGLSSVARRGARVLTALVHVGLAVVAVRIALAGDPDDQRGGGSGLVERTTRPLLDSGWGRLAVGLVAAVLIGIGIGQVVRGLGIRDGDTLDTGGMPAWLRRTSTVLGVVGHTSRGLVFGLVGWFFAVAAVTHDADDAKGLDLALRSVRQAAWGPALLVAMAAGLVSYALFCGVASRYKSETT